MAFLIDILDYAINLMNLSSTLNWSEQIKVTFKKLNGKYATFSKEKLKFYEKQLLDQFAHSVCTPF